jgi:hypothetical protein
MVRFPVLPDSLRHCESGKGPLSIVNTIEELLERKSSDSGLEIEITAVGIRRADYTTSSIRES